MQKWVEVEAAVRSSSEGGHRLADKESGGHTGGYRPRSDDIRIALFFLFFVQIAFFGTGK